MNGLWWSAVACQQTLKWWRRRESNPRPQDLCLWLYMLIRSINLTRCYLIGKEDNERFRLSFNKSTPNKFHCGLVRIDA